MEEPRPHPANVPGDYFVEDGCCLTCDVPFSFAPDHFAWFLDPEGLPEGCFVKRQPRTPEEHERMFETIRHAEANCIKYRGRDRAIQERLVGAGEGPVCINLPSDLKERSDRVMEAQPWRRGLTPAPDGKRRTLAEVLREARGSGPPLSTGERKPERALGKLWRAVYQWFRGDN